MGPMHWMVRVSFCQRANRWSTADGRSVLNESEIVIPQMGRQKMLFRELNHYKENLYYSSLSVDSGQNNKEILMMKRSGSMTIHKPMGCIRKSQRRGTNGTTSPGAFLPWPIPKFQLKRRRFLSPATPAMRTRFSRFSVTDAGPASAPTQNPFQILTYLKSGRSSLASHNVLITRVRQGAPA